MLWKYNTFLLGYGVGVNGRTPLRATMKHIQHIRFAIIVNCGSMVGYTDFTKTNLIHFDSGWNRGAYKA